MNNLGFCHKNLIDKFIFKDKDKINFIFHFFPKTILVFFFFFFYIDGFSLTSSRCLKEKKSVNKKISR